MREGRWWVWEIIPEPHPPRRDGLGRRAEKKPAGRIRVGEDLGVSCDMPRGCHRVPPRPDTWVHPPVKVQARPPEIQIGS